MHACSDLVLSVDYPRHTHGVPPPPLSHAGTWALSALAPGLACLLLTPALLYILYPPEVKDTPDAPKKVAVGGRVGLRGILPPSSGCLSSSVTRSQGARAGTSPQPRTRPSPLCPAPPHPPQAAEELKKLGPMSTDEKLTAGALGITVALWIFGGSFGINAVAAALTGLTILLVTGVRVRGGWVGVLLGHACEHWVGGWVMSATCLGIWVFVHLCTWW
jgi:hypothetical protein